MKQISVVLVEDDKFTKQTLSYTLKKQEEIELVAAFDNGQEVVDYTKINTPDVILMDIDMPVMNGIVATEEIKKFNPNISIIMLTAHNDKSKVLEAFSSGANGYCVKQIKVDELIYVIKTVFEGGVWFDKQIAKFIFEILKQIDAKKESSSQPAKTTDDYSITERERNIIKLVSDGLSNSEIADTLIISPNTVKNHIASIIKKLGVKDRTQIAIFALKNEIL